MGRHGTGGSDDGDERGSSSAFWGPDEQAEPPGWPSLPDQPEVTGQWAPMPRREHGPPPRGPEPEPFETTGAFALPNDPAGGFPPANDPAGSFPPPYADEAGPFETTGAFARPPDWDQSADRPAAGPLDGPGADGPAERTGFFTAPGRSGFNAPDRPAFDGQDAGHPGVFGGPPGPHDGPFDRPAPYDGQGTPGVPGPFDRPGPYDGPGGGAGPFDRPGGHPGPYGGPGGFEEPWDGAGVVNRPAGGTGPFDHPSDGAGPFDHPSDGTGPFGQAPDGTGPFDGPDDRTARFDAPSGPRPVYGGPPEPGDVKVAGEPTAALTPAWAEAETGFLGAGWSQDSGIDDADEPRGRRGRRKAGRDEDLLAAPSGGGGRGRVALLSVAAVAVVLGGTVAGVNFMSGSDPKCAGATCAAVQAPSAPPSSDVAEPPVEEESEPVEEEPSAEESTSSEAPTPTATYSAPLPRRTAAPRPTPTKTKVKVPKAADEEPVEEPPVEESASETPPEEVSTLDDSDTAVAPTVDSTPVPTASNETLDSAPGIGDSVKVEQTVRQRLTNYSAQLKLSNAAQAPLKRPTISLPVSGRVMNVTGADWSQDGDLLILDLPESLPAGDSVDVSFTATGRGSEPGNCGLISGECAVI
ncbi:hypothetical protein ITP53_24135 [Nonomuraea sp. K274]|uniref:Uncharacterized protein n=1 Tax=Nonomuraea cypriaca TaxID=1187855 RepID=A0A931F268_9ACTN|nr:hypothetical protein [Nonomuraea cypriaca]MBF8188766.1 hypothetical protein [Nonomuraea cypriaca]